MGKSNRAYKSAKRNKEILRQKKREEKRQRRLAKYKKPDVAAGGESTQGDETPGSQTPELK